MTDEEREQVVELLRVAADVSGIAGAFERKTCLEAAMRVEERSWP